MGLILEEYLNLMIFRFFFFLVTFSWSIGNALVSGVGDLRIKSRAGQSGLQCCQWLATVVTFLQTELRRDAEMGPANAINASVYIYSKFKARCDLI